MKQTRNNPVFPKNRFMFLSHIDAISSKNLRGRHSFQLLVNRGSLICRGHESNSLLSTTIKIGEEKQLPIKLSGGIAQPEQAAATHRSLVMSGRSPTPMFLRQSKSSNSLSITSNFKHLLCVGDPMNK